MVGIGLSQSGGQQLILDTAVYGIEATVGGFADRVLSKHAIVFPYPDALYSGLDAQSMRGAEG